MALFGITVIESPHLPTYPSPGTDARRIVRHGMADVLAWLGEDVGPKPGEPTHAFLIGSTLAASAAMVGRLRSLPDPTTALRAGLAGWGDSD
ncbi:hypothetical protein [Nocardioides massiliensis]|uniref:ADP-dependent phosphofructokinase/glucokinase n=1 Tax=Nocardioides massiliensis TaxID=1325935 RepID=A0ABT9NJ64_9ACTN|nr:hypothetical protein [Nocardioides massiliensis]MDP9820459.1 ADP-dependent phosphofructokinase/glucokinase [Nocardioides massiliensis]